MKGRYIIWWQNFTLEIWKVVVRKGTGKAPLILAPPPHARAVGRSEKPPGEGRVVMRWAKSAPQIEIGLPKSKGAIAPPPCPLILAPPSRAVQDISAEVTTKVA